MKIEKKIWSEYFEQILTGDKHYELRLADWECQPGDILVLKEWDKEKQEYTGRIIEETVTHILKTKNVEFWPKEEMDKYGFQIISFK